MEISHTFRETNNNPKPYLDHIVEQFSGLWIKKYYSIYGERKISAIAFGKQDMRGAPSITMFDERHCVPYQKHFGSNKEMLAFMQGFVASFQNFL